MSAVNNSEQARAFIFDNANNAWTNLGNIQGHITVSSNSSTYTFSENDVFAGPFTIYPDQDLLVEEGDELRLETLRKTIENTKTKAELQQKSQLTGWTTYFTAPQTITYAS